MTKVTEDNYNMMIGSVADNNDESPMNDGKF